MTVKELKAALDAEGIDYPSGAKKANLEALLAGASPSASAGGKTRPDGPIKIHYSVTTADGETHKGSEIVINNPRGCMPASKVCDIDYIAGSLKRGIKERFGALHVR